MDGNQLIPGRRYPVTSPTGEVIKATLETVMVTEWTASDARGPQRFRFRPDEGDTFIVDASAIGDDEEE